MIKDYENYFNDLLGGAPVTSKGAVENGTSSQQNVLNGSARNNDAIDDFLDRTGPGSYAPAVGSAYASETTMNARLAYEDQNSPPFYATFMNNPEDFKARARTFFSHRRVQLAVIISLVALCVLIVAISLGTKPDSGAANTAEIPNNTEDTPEQQQFLTDIKKLVSEKSRQELERSGSPQSQAINWLFTESDFLGYPQEKRVQRYVLATLYYATAGESWAKSEKWLSQADECTWYWSGQPESQVCDDNLNLLNLVLPGNTLVGTLPDEVSLLTTIKQIDLSQNSINSSLDASFGALTNIETLHLSTNQFQGQMPGEIGRLSSLVELLLHDNRFTGSLPSELGLLTSLTALHVDSNNGLLAETIPEEICSLTIDHGLSPQALVVDCDVISCNCCSGYDGNRCAGTDQPVPETGSPAIPETAAPTNGGTPQPTTSEPCNEADVFDCRRKYMRG
jgi:Leucine-rich repeat (LRR) protein